MKITFIFLQGVVLELQNSILLLSSTLVVSSNELFQWNRFSLISKAYTCEVLQMMILLGNYVLRLRNFSGRLVLTIE